MRFPEALAGGGSTRFAPVFEWVAREPLAPDALVYFTDGLAEFPERPPPYPVLWVVSGQAQVPWGTRVQLN
jgi:predicted metal-dependent peptidase